MVCKFNDLITFQAPNKINYFIFGALVIDYTNK